MTFHELKRRLRALVAPRRVERELDDARGTALVDGCVRDVLYAFRTFRRAPLAALTIVTTVALGLGLVAVVFLARMETYFLQLAFWLTLVLGGLALLLTLSGLFSVLSYLVEQRMKEIGVRLALGATTGNVGRLERVINGFQVSGTLQAYSRLPFNITSGVTTIQGTPGRPIVNGAFILIAAAAALILATCASQPTPTYDLVIANGRAMDPESGLDAVRHVGIRGGTIEAVSTTTLTGARVIDAARHVVAPGFIDLHEHGQQEESYRMMVRDGVTSAFELEVGTGDVAEWYKAREGGQIVNYGVSIGHIPARMKVLGDPGKGLLPAGIGGSGSATDGQMAAMETLLREGLAQGAVAMGFGSAYTPGAPISEIERMFRVAAAGGVSAHIHMRGGLAGLRETIAAAKSAGTSLHIVHVNSSAGNELEGFLSAIQAARDAGQDVTTEAYPYGAGMTEIQSALFDDWATWPDERFGLHQLVSSGERLTRATFGKARAAGGTVIIHGRSETQTRAAIVSPLSMIASDGFIENGRGHPRTSGTFAKVLGKYVRDEGAITLMDALRRMTLEPARRLERRTPAMSAKGRISVGADADVTIFDPATVIDRATYEDATLPSAGIPYVIVGGQAVVDGGQVTSARPGRAIRAPIR